jgi:hypothetical protein
MIRLTISGLPGNARPGCARFIANRGHTVAPTFIDGSSCLSARRDRMRRTFVDDRILSGAFYAERPCSTDSELPAVSLMQNSIQGLHAIAIWKFAMCNPRALTNL